jgi:hypothetical protein
MEQKGSSEDGSDNGRNCVPPCSTRPYQGRQRDDDIRHNKEECAFRKPPEKREG